MEKTRKFAYLVLVVSALYLLVGYNVSALIFAVLGIIFLNILFMK